MKETHLSALSGRVRLTNDGQLDVYFLGVGSAFARLHFQTSLLIVKGKTHLLVDFGMDGPRALDAAGLTMADIEYVLPTHSHADHVGGLEALALYSMYVARPYMGKPKPKIIITNEYQRLLWDRTLRGGLEYNTLKADRYLSFGDYFDFITPRWKTAQPREIFEVGLGDIKLELFRTNHIPEQAKDWEASFISYGLLIDDRVFYSGDSQFDPQLLSYYADRYAGSIVGTHPMIEGWFHDVQFFPGAVHAPLADLKTLPDTIKKSMYLVHYSDEWQKHPADGFAGYAQQGTRYRF